jgi:hypothetical protein
MSRHLRCNVRGGWCHVATRGVRRRVQLDADIKRRHDRVIDILSAQPIKPAMSWFQIRPLFPRDPSSPDPSSLGR